MKIENEIELNKLIKGDSLPCVWFFYGSDNFLKINYRNALVARLLQPQAMETDYTEFDTPFLVMDDLEGCMQFFPLMSERRVVMLTGFTPEKMNEADFAQLLELVSEPIPSAVLIISADDKLSESNARAKKLIAAAAKSGVAALLAPRKRGDLVKFVKSELGKFNCGADNAACYKIIDLCGADMQAIANECAKLGAYGAGGTVTQQDAEYMISTAIDESVFDMVKNIIAGNGRMAAKRLNALLEAGEAPPAILGAILFSYNDLQKATAVRRDNVDVVTAASQLGYTSKNAFRLERSCSQVSHLRQGYATECLMLVMEAGKFIRSCKTDMSTVLVKLVSDLCAVNTD